MIKLCRTFIAKLSVSAFDNGISCLTQSTDNLTMHFLPNSIYFVQQSDFELKKKLCKIEDSKLLCVHFFEWKRKMEKLYQRTTISYWEMIKTRYFKIENANTFTKRSWIENKSCLKLKTKSVSFRFSSFPANFDAITFPTNVKNITPCHISIFTYRYIIANTATFQFKTL